MACDAVIDFLQRETNRFNEILHQRIFPRSPIVGLTPKAAFPEGIGEVIVNITYERRAPAVAEPDWNDLVDQSTLPTIPTSETGGCARPAHKIDVGSTTRSYNVKVRELEGPDFCVEHLRTPYQVAQQLDQTFTILSDYAMSEWEIRYRHEYFRQCKRKVVCIGAGNYVKNSANGTLFPTASDTGTCANANLSQGMLNLYKPLLMRDGALGMGMIDGAKVLTLMTDMETSDRLIFENADIRQDLRYGKPSELLAPYGVSRDYRGFYHLIDPFPIRATCSSGTYTEVPAFADAAATKGNKSDVNDSWNSATTTVSFIYEPSVFTARIPQPITNPGGNVRFNAVNYAGRFELLNILDRTCNKWGTNVFHGAILGAGTEPRYPERGIAFLHKHCDPAPNATTACA